VIARGMFTLYLVVIVGALVCFVVIGVLQR